MLKQVPGRSCQISSIGNVWPAGGVDLQLPCAVTKLSARLTQVKVDDLEYTRSVNGASQVFIA